MNPDSNGRGIFDFTLLKHLRRLSCVRSRRQSAANNTQGLTDYEKFLFCAGASAATGLLAATVYPAVAAGAFASCVPLVVLVEPPLSGLDPRIFGALPESPKSAAAALTTISGIQGSLGAAELLLADPWTGGSHIGLALFGNFVARPEGLGLLPTFSLVAGLNAAVGALKAFVVFGARKKSLVISGTIITNYLKFAIFAHPALYGLACLYSWRLLNGLRDTFVPTESIGNGFDAMRPVASAPVVAQPFLPFTGQGRLAGAESLAQLIN
jgi:hypothetical protein